MKIFYLATIRLPTEKAHGLQIMKTCEALAAEGVQVELIVPKRTAHLAGDAHHFYGVKRVFSVVSVPGFDFISRRVFGPLGYWLQSYFLFRRVKKRIREMTKMERDDVVYYTRDLPLAWLLNRVNLPFFYELHALPDTITWVHRKVWRSVWRHCRGFIVISDALKRALVALGIKEESVLVARDAVDMAKYARAETKLQCRQKLELSEDEKIVVYTGHLYEWKGAATLAKAVPLLPSVIQVYIVGGTPYDVERFRISHQLHNLHITGWQPHDRMPWWQKAADVVVLPTSGRALIGRQFTSPLKLFEYIAAGTPIVASRLPSIQEVLSENQAIFFEPDNPADLARAITVSFNRIDQLTKTARVLAERMAKQYSWEERGKRIKNFIGGILAGRV